MILIIDAVLLITVIYLWYISERKWMTVYVGFDSTNKNWNYFLCDGEADNVQIQQALDAMPRWGGIVNLGAGSFHLRDSVDLFELTQMRGWSQNLIDNTIILCGEQRK